MGKLCKDCDKSFFPTGKSCRFCSPCLNKRRRKQNKVLKARMKFPKKHNCPFLKSYKYCTNSTVALLHRGPKPLCSFQDAKKCKYYIEFLDKIKTSEKGLK